MPSGPVWMISLNRALAERVLHLVPELIASLPAFNATNAEAAWRDYGEIIVVDSGSTSWPIS